MVRPGFKNLQYIFDEIEQFSYISKKYTLSQKTGFWGMMGR